MSFSQTQLDMFNNMPGIDDDDEVADDTTSTEGQEPAATPQPGQADNADDNSGATADAPASGTGTSGQANSNAGQTAQQADPLNGLVPRADPANPKVVNLVDPKTGEIIVHGGVQKRLYDTAQRATREKEAAIGRVQELEQQVRAFQSANTMGTQLQLAPQEQVDAMRLMADFKRAPAETLQRIINEVQATGIDLPFLNQGINPSVIEGIIDRKLQPVLAPQQQAREQQAAQAEAQKTLDTFLDQYDDAQIHLPLIAEMLGRDPTMTLERAYNNILRFSATHGLSFTEPLDIQVARRNATGAQPRQANTPASAEKQPTRALPNGRTAAAHVSDADDVAEYGASDSWETIIRSALRRNNVV